MRSTKTFRNDGSVRLAICGTYDLGKPRVRLLVDCARPPELDVVKCHVDVWSGVEDKTQLAGWPARCRRGLRWLLAYPTLIFGYLRLPAHRYLLVPYLGTAGAPARRYSLVGRVHLAARHGDR